MVADRYLLLNEQTNELRESVDDVKTVAMLAQGWVDVTGLPEFEQRCTEELHRDISAKAW